jgi:hypothetical protein
MGFAFADTQARTAAMNENQAEKKAPEGADAGSAGADGKQAENSPVRDTPPADKKPLSEGAAAAGSKAGEESAGGREKDVELERAIAAKQAEHDAKLAVLRAGIAEGVKDVEAFELLAEKERGAKGKDFDPAAFAKAAKESRPYLFAGVPEAKPSTTTAAGPAAKGTSKREQLLAERAEALRAGSAAKILYIDGQLASLGE